MKYMCLTLSLGRKECFLSDKTTNTQKMSKVNYRELVGQKLCGSRFISVQQRERLSYQGRV